MHNKNLGSYSVWLKALFVLVLVSTTTNVSLAGCEHSACSVNDTSDAGDFRDLSDFSDFKCQPQTNQPLRLNRAEMFSTGFSSALPGRFATLWWRNLRRPSFCNMVLCHGACSWQGDGRHSACSLVPMYPVLPDPLLDSRQEAGLAASNTASSQYFSCSGDRVF